MSISMLSRLDLRALDDALSTDNQIVVSLLCEYGRLLCRLSELGARGDIRRHCLVAWPMPGCSQIAIG